MHFQEGDKGPFLISHRNGRINIYDKTSEKKKCELRIKELTQSFPSKGILHLGGKKCCNRQQRQEEYLPYRNMMILLKAGSANQKDCLSLLGARINKPK
jgi:hypothetical protein